MEIFLYFKPTAHAMLQIFLLAAVGFLLTKKRLLSSEGLTGLAGLLITVVFPALIFRQLVTKFSFTLYPNWWVFVFLSIAITVLGLFVAYLISLPVKDALLKREFISLVAFQNSGYLPLTLIAWIAPKEQLSTMLIYLFLFLLGFNLVIWSWGAYFLSGHKLKRFTFASLFSPPVIATLLGFLFVLLKINTIIPNVILTPLELLGNCSFPFAILVVGASLGDLDILRPVDKALIAKLVLAKLVILPAIGLAFISLVKLPYLVGMLLILELAAPSATSLAIIVRRYDAGERIISQGIFISHLLSLLTLPIFLSLFNYISLSQR